jgi:two-component system, cell cycle sensor histidine kinase PleC
MAGAEAAGPSSGRYWPFAKFFSAARPAISGHARLLARPAYRKLVAAEPRLRRLIPILIIVFLSIVGLARFVELYEFKHDRESNARDMITMTASVLASTLDGAPGAQTTSLSRDTLLNIIANALPPGAMGDGRRVLVTDREGVVVATAPRSIDVEGTQLTKIIGETQPLTTFGARAGVLEIALADETPAFATVHLLANQLGSVAVIEPTEFVYSDWRADISLNVTIFVGTSAILLVIIYGYFTQATRANEADRIYLETQERFETALMRGRSGLWDWDLARGHMFWSRSMFELLGFEPRDDLIGFGEVTRLIHPDDGDLMAFTEALYEAGEATVDRMFRMRHCAGHWVWLRVRAELVDPDSGEPHLIGIAVDVSEQMQLVEHTKTADIRLHDAIETISEAFVLWDADNRLVMCNSKFQRLHGIPDSMLAPGTPYSEVVKAGRNSMAHSHVIANAPHNEGERSFEVQIEAGQWLQINERRTKDGGFVSVGTDITQLKRHEGRLIDGERQLMATIADLRQSRQKLEMQAQQMVDLADKYAEEKNRAEDANRTKSQFLANISHELRTPLNAVIGFSEIMQSEMFGKLGSPKYREYCSDIHQSGIYLLGVINDILDMSRIEAGRMALDLEDLALDEIVDESIRIVRTQAEAQKIKVISEVDEDLTMRGDRRALKQIMLNLLSNAVKFTPAKGEITIRARTTGAAIVFSVKDTGIGIPQEALEKLGRPFEQVGNQFTKSHRGSGLGLAITSSLTELHCGAMRIRSREGHGTVVSVRLPVAPPEAPSADAA